MEKKPNVPTEFTYGEIVALFFEFEGLLQTRLKVVPSGSNLEQAGLTAIEMLATFRKEIPHDYKKDYRNDWRRVLSMADILRKILALRT